MTMLSSVCWMFSVYLLSGQLCEVAVLCPDLLRCPQKKTKNTKQKTLNADLT